MIKIAAPYPESVWKQGALNALNKLFKHLRSRGFPYFRLQTADYTPVP